MTARDDEQVEVASVFEIQVGDAPRQGDHPCKRQRADPLQRPPVPFEKRPAARFAAAHVRRSGGSPLREEKAVARFDHGAERGCRHTRPASVKWASE